MLIGLAIIPIGLALSTQPQGNSETGTKAPGFTLPAVSSGSLTTESIALSSYKGKVVLLEFMEPWCGHCQKMAPVLDRLHSKYAPLGVVFISVAGSEGGATLSDVARFVSSYKVGWPVVYDQSNTVLKDYGVSAVPVFFVVSKNGSILSKFTGEVPYETLDSVLSRAVE